MKSKRDRKIHKDVTIKLVSLVRERVYMKYYASFNDVFDGDEHYLSYFGQIDVSWYLQ